MNKSFFYRFMVLSIGMLLVCSIACKNPVSSPSDSGTGNGASPFVPSFTQVAYGTNGADLKNWLTDTASSTEINRIEVTGVPPTALAGTAAEASAVGKIIKESGKMVALKLPAQTPTPSLKNSFKDCTNLMSVQLEYEYEAGKFDDAFAGCTGLGRSSIMVPLEQLQAYQAAATAMGVSTDRFIPSSIAGVWRFISEQNQGEPIKTFPQLGGLGGQIQPYFCFNQGKLYHALKFSRYPADSPQKNGVFQMPGSWGTPYIAIIMSFNVTVSGNELTLEEPGRVILKMEKVSDPTVDQILAAKPM